MKKRIAITLALLLIPALAFAAYQWNGAAVTVWNGASVSAWNGAVTGGASCTTSNDTKIVDNLNTGIEKIQSNYACQKITVTSGATITQYIADICTIGGTGPAVLQLYTDSSNVPGSAITGTTANVSTAATCDTFETVLGTLATPYVTSTTTYWVCNHQSDGATYAFYLKYQSESGKRITHGDTVTEAPTDDFSLGLDVMGCNP